MIAAVALTLVLGQVKNVLTDPDVFPIGVWLQVPANAPRYQKAGINLYVALWEGPTERQLADLKKAGMPVICDQNAVGLGHRSDPTIVAWMQQDEPDNAQAVPGGYGPCVPPLTIVRRYEEMKRKDPSRPVYLGLGQGVANDEWVGRGSGAKLEDYKTYVKGGDIVGYDIYPVAGYEKPRSEDYLHLVSKGVDRLQDWVKASKPTWNCVECTGIASGKKATPAQVKAEVWMSIIHGSRGIVYFVHEFKPVFKEAALLEDKAMLEAVTAINRQVQSLAGVLRKGVVVAGVEASSQGAPVDVLAKSLGGKTYVFAVGMRNQAARAEFTVPGVADGKLVDVLGEGRSVTVRGGRFSDAFAPYGVHLYSVR